MASVYLLDTTNRDGVQTARITLSKLQKTLVNLYLGRMGVHQSEIGFPSLHHEQNYIAGNLELAAQGAFGEMVLSGWLRAHPQDLEAALQTGLRHFDISMSTSPQMMEHKFGGRFSQEEVIHITTELVENALAGGAETLIISAEDSSRSDLGFLVEFAQAVRAAGATRLRYCDTLGCDSPTSIARRVRVLAEQARMPIELHCHNDLGMAVANSVEGARAVLEGGQDAWINTTVNGMGERAGNADLISVLLACQYAQELAGELPLAGEVDLQWAWPLAGYVARSFGLPIPINQVGVGANIFAHESGIHADGTLKDRHNYELFDFDLLGRPEGEIVPTGRVITTGEYGGVAGLRHVYSKLGIEFETDAEAREVLKLVQFANAHNQAPLTADELRFLASYPVQALKILTPMEVDLRLEGPVGSPAEALWLPWERSGRRRETVPVPARPTYKAQPAGEPRKALHFE
ncbi:MAG: homocitrate synthase/isopropylmalate synthase family protein [Anaerolineae bacterium]